MKIKINKNLKMVVISLLTLLVLGSSFLLYKELNNPKFEEHTNPIYSYSNKSTIDYRVFLKPNNLYDKNYLEEGLLYISEYVDYIKADFNYEFHGERDASISGDYNIIARIQAYMGEDEKRITIWEKDFPLMNKNFKTEERIISINENINIGLDEYVDFVTEINESSKINSQTALILMMNVNLKGDTDKGPIEETVLSNLYIPINTPMFQIDGENYIEKDDAIVETTNVAIPIDRNKMILFGAIIGISILILVYLIFFASIAAVKDPFDKELSRIFKKYGDRLVALNNHKDLSNPNYIKSIEDLIKISDEINQPIFYRYSEDYKEMDKFYMIHGDILYVLDLSELLQVEEAKGLTER